MTFLLKKGRVFVDGSLQETDLLIEKGKIAKLGKGISADEELDITGLVILPGLIDVHVHFRAPGHPQKEDFGSGSSAAAAGGVTTVLDMPNNQPPVISQQDLDAKRKMAEKSLVNYGLYIGATKENINLMDATDAIAIKVYMGSSTGSLLLDNVADFARLMERTEKLVVVHAENEQLIRYFSARFKETKKHHLMRDNLAAGVAIAEAAVTSSYYGKRLHIAHMSTKEEASFLRKFKDENVTCEVCPHHLFLSSAFFEREGNKGKMNPPLRSEADRKALWQAIKDGIVDMVATDHAPHTREEKMAPFEHAPCGVPGVQTTLPLMLNEVAKGALNMKDLVRLCSTRPAEVFGITGRGSIAVGNWADLAIVDPARKETITNDQQLSRCGWTPFHGTHVTGWPVMTLVNGAVVWKEGKILNAPRGMEVGPR